MFPRDHQRTLRRSRPCLPSCARYGCGQGADVADPPRITTREGLTLMASFDPARVSKAEWIGLGAGLIAFIASFLPWYSVSAGLFSVSINAWSLGFLAWFPVLLMVAAAGVILAQQLGANMPQVRPGWPLVLLGVAALSLILVLIRWVSLTADTYGFAFSGISYGAGFGLYVGLVAAILLGLSQYLVFRSSGQSIAEAARQLRNPGTNQTPPNTY
jgi:hypothetical protein